MTDATELRRAARAAETAGDFAGANRLRETLPPEPAPVMVIARVNVADLLDEDLVALAEACADEMIRRGREAVERETR